MKTLSREIDNLGGLSRLWCIPPSMIIEILPERSTGYHFLQVYSLGSAWAIHAIPESLEYIETEKQADAGTIYEASITGRLAKDCPELHQSLKSLRPKPWVVVYQDQNGSFKLVGSPNEPLWFSTELRTSASYAGLNHVRFSFSGSLTIPARFLRQLPEGM